MDSRDGNKRGASAESAESRSDCAKRSKPCEAPTAKQLIGESSEAVCNTSRQQELPLTSDAIAMRYPRVDESKTPLPRRWSETSKHRFVHLRDCLRASYIGRGVQRTDVGGIRASHSIPIDCDVYYYEVTVIRDDAHCGNVKMAVGIGTAVCGVATIRRLTCHATA